MKLEKIIDNNLYVFLLKAFLFYIVWQITYDYVIAPDQRIDYFLSTSVASMTTFILSAMDWDISVSGRVVTISGFRGVEVLNECNALKLMALYSGFILAYTGNAVKKIWYVLGGIGLIYVLNVLRIVAFSLATVYFQAHWDTFHEISSFIFFYPLILWLWFKWTLLEN